MEFKIREMIVDETQPFLNDKLNREPHVKNLSRLLLNISSPISLAINAPWGHGKTAFLKMLKAQLDLNSATTIYFSAWETDFASDPLVVFLGEMNKTLHDWTYGNNKKRAAWEKAKNAGLYLAKRSIPVGVKLSTLGLLDTDKVVEDEVARLSAEISSDVLREYAKSKQQIKYFKDNIHDLLADDQGYTNKLYIIIDELDRCRPSYAIEFLERIKHLLEVEGLVFVLALDKKQLSHSIRGVYGADFDSVGYMRRFFDIEYLLPDSNIQDYIKHSFNIFGFNEYFDARYQKYGQRVKNEPEHLHNVSMLLYESFKFSLREFEQAFSKLNLFLLSSPQDAKLHIPLVAFLIFLKEYDFDAYSRFIASSSPDSTIDYFLERIPLARRYSFECALVEGFLLGAKTYHSLNENIIYKGHESEADDPDLIHDSRNYSLNVVHIAADNRLRADYFNQIIQHIEMLESYDFG